MAAVDTMVTDERKWLAGELDGLTDDEVLDFVRLMGGAEPLLEIVFLLMPQELNQEAAEDGVVGWNIETESRMFSYGTEILDGELVAHAGAPADARVRLSMSLPVFFRLITELMDAVKAFADEEVRVDGDLLYAMRLQPMFRAAPVSSPVTAS